MDDSPHPRGKPATLPPAAAAEPQRRLWLARVLGLGACWAAGGSGGNVLAASAPASAPAPVLRRRPLVFPTDHGAHPAQGIEWWYLTGWLAPAGAADPAPAAPALGFQLTFFRSRGPARLDHPSRFAARQVLMAHSALTVLPGAAASVGALGAGRLNHDQRIARVGPGSASAAEGDTAVSLGAGERAWWLRRCSGESGRSIYEAQFGLDRAALDPDGGAGRSSTTGAVRLALTLVAPGAPLQQGQAGWSRKGPQADQASFYVSEPQLQLSGRLALPLQQRQQQVEVSGRAWLDHEWSEAILPAQAEGWDWLGINLFDGSALTLFRLRQRTAGAAGSSAPGGGQADAQTGVLWAGGSWRGVHGTSRSYAPGEVGMSALRHWRSPATGAVYPVAWRLVTPNGRFELRALLDAQELDARASSATVYWEGLAELVDPADGRRLGLGYLELTGYAGRPAL